MFNSVYDSDTQFDYETINPDIISLSPQNINQALDWCRSLPGEDKQWQTYLNGLAFLGFENWLDYRGSGLTLNFNQCSLHQPELSYGIDAVLNLTVNEFKICLIALSSVTDQTVILPRAIFDLPEYTAHYYILLEVQEELETALIYGFISYQNWLQHQHHFNLKPNADWTYTIPLSWFISEPDQLLLYLRCLNVEAIPLPEIPNRLAVLSQLQEPLMTQLPQLKPQAKGIIPPIWQVLTWEQAEIVLTQPQLLRWVYDVQNQASLWTKPVTTPAKSSTVYLADLFKLLTQPVLNVRQWFNQEIETLSNQLSWILMPEFSPVTAFRSGKQMQTLVQELQENNVEIPLQAKAAYRDVEIGGRSLRLYALTWPLTGDMEPEWTLLLILGVPSGTDLPSGTKLRVSDTTGILVEQSLNSHEQCSYLFTRVVGTWAEKFVVTIGLKEEFEETLPIFGFNGDFN